MRLLWSVEGWEDYLHWQENDRKILAKIDELVRDVRRSPFKGLGKPEPLKERFTGWWSRRITDEHRLVYRVTGKPDDQVMENLAVPWALLTGIRLPAVHPAVHRVFTMCPDTTRPRRSLRQDH